MRRRHIRFRFDPCASTNSITASMPSLPELQKNALEICPRLVRTKWKREGRALDHIALQHRWGLAMQLRDQFRDDTRMVMTSVVTAITGQAIENHATIVGIQLGAPRTRVTNVHLQYGEELGPNRIDVPAISLLALESNQILVSV